jgi:hypothetical protein
VQVVPLTSVQWDGYGRLLAGGRGDGLARSVAAAARRYALSSAAHRRVAAARAADAAAARRVQDAAARASRLRGLEARDRRPAGHPAGRPHMVRLATVSSPEAGAGRVLGTALLVVLAGLFGAGMPSPLRRAAGD